MVGVGVGVASYLREEVAFSVGVTIQSISGGVGEEKEVSGEREGVSGGES